MHYTNIAAAALAALAFGASGAAMAETAIMGNRMVVAPPAVVVEAVPAQRAGAVWMPGRQVWQNGAFHWQAGHWIANQPGLELTEKRWVLDNDRNWQVAGGEWQPNRYLDRSDDRRDDLNSFGRADLDGDRVANRDDNDWDGDGVANWNDHFPLDKSRF